MANQVSSWRCWASVRSLGLFWAHREQQFPRWYFWLFLNVSLQLSRYVGAKIRHVHRVLNIRCRCYNTTNIGCPLVPIRKYVGSLPLVQDDIWPCLVGRLISGLGVGALSAVVPMVCDVIKTRSCIPYPTYSIKRRRPLLKFAGPWRMSYTLFFHRHLILYLVAPTNVR